MEIDVRAVSRLRDSAGAQAAFGPLVAALARSTADLAQMRVVCDWIQYKNNFRDTAMVRRIVSADAAADACELALDLRRCAQPGTDVAAEVTASLAEQAPDADDATWRRARWRTPAPPSCRSTSRSWPATPNRPRSRSRRSTS
jgi:hypothetical protein